MDFELLLPAHAAIRLRAHLGEPIVLRTVFYIEAGAQATIMIPRLIGFAQDVDLHLFELLRQVKGIGPRKALRCMAMESATIARAIADRDVKMLQSLPEIGKRTAETIITTLHDKVEALAGGASQASQAAGVAAGVAPTTGISRQAVEVLVQLGESRASAIRWVDAALAASNDELDDVQLLVREALAQRSGPQG